MDASRLIVVGSVTVLLLLSGCLSGNGVGGQQSPAMNSTPTVTPATSTTACPHWVSFYGLDSSREIGWAPDRISIGYTVPGNASVFFVAFEEGTVVGTTHVTTSDLEYGVTADGDGIPLDQPLRGSHLIRVRAYHDTNENGRFDFGTDAPCRTDGELVEAGPRRINFSRLQGTPTSPPGTHSPTGTATPNGNEHAANQPDPDKKIRLTNKWNQTVTIQLRIIREATSETVHTGTYQLAPDSERDVYTLATADPDGIEAFTVGMTARNTTQRVTLKTNKCYGNAHGEIREDGTVYLFYAIC